MKHLGTYINERIKDAYIYHPKTKEDLIKCINELIEATESGCVDLNCIDTSAITDMGWLVEATSKAHDKNLTIDISGWDTSNVKNMSFMFFGSRFNGYISKWDVSKVENMECMFCGAKFNQDISKWDVSSVRDMSQMFRDSSFNHDISRWDTSSVENMRSMFEGSRFNKDISKWDVKNAFDVHKMFYDSPLSKNPPEWYKNKI